MTRNRSWALALAAGMLLGLATAPAHASEVRQKINNLARDIARLLKEETQTQVAVQDFTGPPTPSTSAGPLIQSTLIDELKKLTITVNDDAFTFIKGDYFILDEKEELKVRITITIRNKKGRKIDELVADIGYRGNDDLPKLLGSPVDVQKIPKADRETVNNEMKKQVDNPPVHIEGTKVQVRKDGPFAVEVRTRPKGGGELVTLRPQVVKKLPFVSLEKDYEYVLVLHNNSKHEAAAIVTIDGLDIFHFFQPADKKPTSFVIAPGKSAVVEGWVFGQKGSAVDYKALLVGRLADSPAAKILKASNSIGTITVCFHPSWKEGDPPPDYSGSRSFEDTATVVGRDIKGKAERVNRTLGPLLQSISIRYKK